MKNLDERWEDFTFEETQDTVRFLNLPNSVMENICRFLPTERDKYVACLIHPHWSTAAQNVLWESPRFQLPARFRSFMTSIRSVKKLALLVRDVQFVFLTHEDSIFKPIVESALDRHSSTNPLADANFITTIVKSCERIKALTFYGWSLREATMEKLSAISTELNSINIIGSPANKKPFSLFGMLNRLTCLRLDGNFNIDERWAETLVNKGKLIQKLHLSLQGLPLSTVAKICSAEGLISLTDLTFTDANVIEDKHVELIVTAFPNLTRFCLEGTIYVTPLSIAHSLNICLNLNSLEIRAHMETLNHGMTESSNTAFNEIVFTHVRSRPHRVLLENLNIDDSHLMALAPYFDYVQTLGFKSCPQITNTGIQSVLESMKYLRTIQFVNCLYIDSNVFVILSTMEHVAKSLFRIRLDSCGPANSKDIYEFCCNCINYNLRQISIVGYPDIQQSAIGNFNEESIKPENEGEEETQPVIVTLNRTSLDALAHSNDPEFFDLPDGRYLSGKQILLLAKNLNISVDELVNILNSLNVEDSRINNTKKSISFNSSTVESQENKSSNRIYSLNNQRPNTPALWSNDFKQNRILYESESDSDQTSNKSETDETYGEENQSYDDENTLGDRTEEDQTGEDQTEEDQTEEDQTEEDEDMDDEKNTPSSKWNTFESNTTVKNTGSEIMLGGWGVTKGWTNKEKSQNAHDTSFSLVAPGYSASSSTQQQPQNGWVGYTEETYKNQWQQTSLEVNATQSIFNKRNKQKHYRNSPKVAESDGWGSVQNFIPWDDLKPQGYAKDVIDQQKSTEFWTHNGTDWARATASSTTNNTNEGDDGNSSTPISGPSTPAASSPPLLFSAIANDVLNSKNNGASNNQHLKNSSKSLQQNVNTRNPRPSSRVRSNSLISSDGSVSWADESPVSIKLSKNEQTTAPNNNNTPRFSTPRNSNTRSKWNSAEEWKSTKEASPTETTSATTTVTTKQSAWQSNISPEEVAKNEWSTIANNNVSPSQSTRRNFSRPPRSANPRHGPRENVNSSWGEFSNNANNTSPPSRSSTSSPPNSNRKNQPTYQKPATPAAATQPLLIDTDNTPSTSSRPQLKGDVWESISTLDIPVTRHNTSEVLVPQGATATKARGFVSTEIRDWSPLDSNTLVQNEDIIEPFRFQKTIPGTVTEDESKLKKKEQDMDNLVDFEELASLPSINNNMSSPSINNNNSSPLVVTPVPKTPQISSNLLNMNQPDTNISSSTPLMDFTSLVEEASTKNTTIDSPSIFTESGPKNDIADFSSLVEQATPKNDIPDFSSLVAEVSPQPIAPKSPHAVVEPASKNDLTDFTSLMAEVAPKNTTSSSDDLNKSKNERNSTMVDFSSLMNDDNLTPSTVPPVPRSDTPNNTTTAISSLKDDANYTTDTSVGSTPEIHEKKPKLFSLGVQLETGPVRFSYSNIREDLEANLQNFCTEHNYNHYYDQIYKKAKENIEEYNTRKILGGKKKKKPSSSTLSS